MGEDLDFFFYSDNANQENDLVRERKKYGVRKLKPYNTSKIKSRNFSKKISYSGVKEDHLYNRNFIFDVYVLITKNINSFSLKRKIFNIKDRDIVYIV